MCIRDRPDGANRFDITLKNHYHVRCIKCGEVSDVDMEEIPDLMKRIHDTHGIDFLEYDIDVYKRQGMVM